MAKISLKKDRVPRNKQGVALVLAMFVLIFIAILVVALLELITSDLQITNNHLGRLKAIYIADAGVEYAVSQLRQNRNWTANPAEVTTFPSGSSSYWSVVYPKTGTTRTIVSLGSIDNNNYAATIEAKISIQGSGSPYNIRIVSWSEI